MSSRKPLQKSKYDESSDDFSNTGSGDSADLSLFSGANPTEPVKDHPMKIPTITKQDIEYEYDEEDEADLNFSKKVAPPYNEADEDDDYEDDKNVKKQTKVVFHDDKYSDYDEEDAVNKNKNVDEQSVEDQNEKGNITDEEQSEEENQKDQKTNKTQAPPYNEEEENEDDKEMKYDQSSSSPMKSSSERFTTSNLPISPNGLNALEANIISISSSDDSANEINQNYKLRQNPRIQEKRKAQEKAKAQESKQKTQGSQSKIAKKIIDDSNEPNSDVDYFDNNDKINHNIINNVADDQSYKRKADYSHSQTSRKSRKSNFGNESHSSKRHLHLAYANIDSSVNDTENDNHFDDDIDNDQVVLRRHSAKSIASSRKSTRSSRSTRTNRTNRTDQANPASPSKRSSYSKRSNITKDTWKEDVDKSVAQKENDRINQLLRDQYNINPDEIQFEIEEQVKKEYNDMIKENCKIIYKNKEILNNQMNMNHYLDLNNNNEIEKLPRNKIQEINNQIEKELLEVQAKLKKVLDENKNIQRKINTIKVNSKDLQQNQTKNQQSNGKAKSRSSRK